MNVLKVALERHGELEAELSRVRGELHEVEAFLSMANELVRQGGQAANEASRLGDAYQEVASCG